MLGRDDVSGVRAFRVSNDGVNWRTYSNTSFGSIPQTISWDLTDASAGGSSQAGLRTVCVLFQDSTGKWSPQITDTISFDPPAPPPPPSSAYGRAIATDRPLGWWRLGETSGSVAVDQMGANNGTYSASGVTLGQTGLVATDPNKAAAFNGSSGSVAIPPASLFSLGRAITLEAWIKPTSLPANGAFRSVLTKAEAYSLQFNGPRLEFTIMQCGTRRRLQTPSGRDRRGRHLPRRRHLRRFVQRLYVNGTQVASVALSGSASSSGAPLVIGSWDGRSEFFSGTLDEAAVYGDGAERRAGESALRRCQSRRVERAERPDRVRQIAHAGRPRLVRQLGRRDRAGARAQRELVVQPRRRRYRSPPTRQSYSDGSLAAGTTYWYRVKAVNGATSSAYSNAVQVTTPAPASYPEAVRADLPVSYWRLGETSGTIAGDVTVANPGTYNGPPTLGAASLVATDQVDPAVAFDGAGDDVRVGQSGSLDLSGALTLEALVKPTSLPAAGSVRSIVAKTGSYALVLNGPALELTIYQLGVARRLQAPAGTIVAGRAYHVAGTFDGATQRLYVNGRQVASVALSGVADTTINGLRIASWDGAQQFFAGTLDEVAVYNKALSATRVAAHFAASQLPLGAPSDLSARAVSASQIDLAWADNAGAETAQVLQRSTDAAFSAPTSISLGANVQSYSDTGRAASTPYWYRVRAVDASDSSAWSPVATATTQAAPAPSSYASVVGADRPVGWWRLGEISGTTAANQAGGGAGTYAGGVHAQPTVAARDRHGQPRGRVQRQLGPRVGPQRLGAAAQNAVAGGVDQADEPAGGRRLPLGPDEGGVVLAAVQRPADSSSRSCSAARAGACRRRPARSSRAGPTTSSAPSTVLYQRLYVNGVQVASAALSGSASVTTSPLVIGSWDGSSEFFAGTIDEPAVYGTVLSRGAGRGAPQSRDHGLTAARLGRRLTAAGQPPR